VTDARSFSRAEEVIPVSLLDQIGAERFRNRTQQIMAAQPLFAWLGACVVAVGEATCEIELQLRQEFMNDRGILQATVLYAVLDAATFVASRTLAEDGKTKDFHQEMKVNFLKAIRAHCQTIKARGHALHRGRSSAVVEGEVFSQDGELVPKALGTIAILRPGESRLKGGLTTESS
jgi:acyl-CoA thioesterase